MDLASALIAGVREACAASHSAAPLHSMACVGDGRRLHSVEDSNARAVSAIEAVGTKGMVDAYAYVYFSPETRGSDEVFVSLHRPGSFSVHATSADGFVTLLTAAHCVLNEMRAHVTGRPVLETALRRLDWMASTGVPLAADFEGGFPRVYKIESAPSGNFAVLESAFPEGDGPASHATVHSLGVEYEGLRSRRQRTVWDEEKQAGDGATTLCQVAAPLPSLSPMARVCPLAHGTPSTDSLRAMDVWDSETATSIHAPPPDPRSGRTSTSCPFFVRR